MQYVEKGGSWPSSVDPGTPNEFSLFLVGMDV